MPTFAERAIERLEPWMTPDLERYLRAIGAMFAQVEALTEEVGSDGEPGYLPPYGRIFDPDLCPYDALGYLGQYVGATVPVGASETEARALVKAESGLNRGTRSSLESAIQRSISNPWMPLTAVTTGQLLSHEASGVVSYYEVTSSFTTPATFNTTHLLLIEITSKYDLIERTKPSGEAAAYWFLVVVNGAQLTPANNAAALEANVNATRPAGLLWRVVQTVEAIWDEATLEWSEVAEATHWSTVTREEIE
jgi:hypothetical protein